MPYIFYSYSFSRRKNLLFKIILAACCVLIWNLCSGICSVSTHCEPGSHALKGWTNARESKHGRALEEPRGNADIEHVQAQATVVTLRLRSTSDTLPCSPCIVLTLLSDGTIFTRKPPRIRTRIEAFAKPATAVFGSHTQKLKFREVTLLLSASLGRLAWKKAETPSCHSYQVATSAWDGSLHKLAWTVRTRRTMRTSRKTRRILTSRESDSWSWGSHRISQRVLRELLTWSDHCPLQLATRCRCKWVVKHCAHYQSAEMLNSKANPRPRWSRTPRKRDVELRKMRLSWWCFERVSSCFCSKIAHSIVASNYEVFEVDCRCGIKSFELQCAVLYSARIGYRSIRMILMDIYIYIF